VRGKWPGKSTGTEKEASTKRSTLKPSAALVRARWRFAWSLAEDETEPRRPPRRSIRAVLQEHGERLKDLPGVTGAGLGEGSGKPCIRVFVERKTPEILERIPETLEGYAVAVEESGEFGRLEPD